MTLTVSSEGGSDTRVKRDLIAVGVRAQLQAELEEPSVTDNPAWWVALAVSPLAAAIWYLQDQQQGHAADTRSLVRTGRVLAALVQARGTETSAGALDLVVERYLEEALLARRRADPIQADRIDRSTAAVDGVRQALLLDALLQSAGASDTELGDVRGAIQDRIDELTASLDALEAESSD